MKTNLLVSSFALSVLASACTNDSLESVTTTETSEINLELSLFNWTKGNGSTTRASGELLYPINVFYTPKEGGEISKATTFEEGSSFKISVPNGQYDLYATCGLPTDAIPINTDNVWDIPNNANDGWTDFALGKTEITVADGKCTPAKPSIVAERQMAWLEVKIEDVPEDANDLHLYIDNISTIYTIGRWAGTKRTPIPIEKKGNTALGSIILPTCSDNCVSLIAEVITKSGEKKTFCGKTMTQLSAGKHLTIKISFHVMATVDNDINIDEWEEEEGTNTLSQIPMFNIGDQYYSLPATVIVNNTTSLQILAHKPMTVTLAEARSWDLKKIPYSLLQEINAERWAFPTSDTSIRNIANAIDAIGWDEFDAQFIANGLTPIDRNASNFLAYYNKTDNAFYSYNFQTKKTSKATDENAEWLVYPLGIIKL